jgi:hypothetical protein
MKGYYIRFQCNDLPLLRWVYDDFTRGPFTAAYYDHFDGGWMVEVVCEAYPMGSPDVTWMEYEISFVHVMEFYSQSLLEVGGVYVDHTGSHTFEDTLEDTLEDTWKKKMGELAFALDSIDISHPHALHACEYKM